MTPLDFRIYLDGGDNLTDAAAELMRAAGLDPAFIFQTYTDPAEAWGNAEALLLAFPDSLVTVALYQPSRLGPGADFIGASDDVMLLSNGRTGVLMDADTNTALVKVRKGNGPDDDPALDGKVVAVRWGEVAHPDSPAAKRVTP